MSQLAGVAPRSTLIDLLSSRAAATPSRLCYVFLDDNDQEESLNFGELDRQARSLGERVRELGLAGERVLILCHTGPEFVVSFFGSLYGGAVPVPAYPPRANRADGRLSAVVADCGAAAALAPASVIAQRERFVAHTPELGSLRWLAPGDGPDLADSWRPPDLTADSLALLQYTSGSTGRPRGVMLSHANVMHNLHMICRAYDLDHEGAGVCWLPMFHDMGLIGNLLEAVYSNGRLVLLSPVAVVQQPLRWLRAVSRYRAVISGGPNFAYEHCARKVTPRDLETLDLSCWKSAFVGAEPINPATLDRFAETFSPCGFDRRAFAPCYGLAEATLMVTSRRVEEGPHVRAFRKADLEQGRAELASADDPDGRVLVSSGRQLADQDVVVVNPETGEPCPPGGVGEIWVSGASVARGYWEKPGANAHTFGGRVAGVPDRTYLRTGDLGFFDGLELYVTGRLKDVLIFRGRNYYPQDIEQEVERCDKALRPGCGAAFAVDEDGEPKLVVVQECERGTRNQGLEEVVAAIRQSVSEEFGLEVHAVALLKTASIPKTSSGKIQRRECRAEYLAGRLDVIHHWQRPTEVNGEAHPDSQAPPAAGRDSVRAWMVRRLADHLKVPSETVDGQRPFASYGLDSVTMVTVANDLQNWLGRPLSPTLLYDAPTIDSLADALTGTAPDQPETRPAGNREPVAVVGVGCRLPGADSPAEFWKMLLDGRDGVCDLPPGRWHWVPPAPAATRGGFLSRVDGFDPQFFGISPREAVSIDPQHRLLLEVAWEALEDAGQPADRLAGRRVGVFVGISSNDYARAYSPEGTEPDAYLGTGNALSMAAARLSYHFDFRGPSLAVDTACSSSLTAVHLACRSLHAGDCELAVVGGVNLILQPEVSAALSQAQMLAADGRCKTFDAAADGYVRGEGCGVVVLKPLSAALRDRNRVLAVVRGTATNQDGHSNGITAPNGLAQTSLIRTALADAGLTPDQVSYVEAHGTGTKLGDPIEVEGLQQALGEQGPPVAVGTVKTNIGHLESAAGVAGLIKAVLTLHHGEVPPLLHLRELSPYLRLNGSRFFVPTGRQPLPSPASQNGDGRHPHFACVSSFSFGGSNAHVVLEEAIARQAPAGGEPAPAETAWLVPLSARSPEALRDLAAAYARFLQPDGAGTDVALTDLAYTTQVGRSHLEHRLAVVVGSREELVERLSAFVSGRDAPGLVSGRASMSVVPPDLPNGDSHAHEPATVLAALASRYLHGGSIEWEKFAPTGGRLVSLPTYPWQRESYWPAAKRRWVGFTAPDDHPLLGGWLDQPCPSWANRLELTRMPFLADHKVRGEVLLPATAFVEMALAAARERHGDEEILLKELRLLQPCPVTGDRATLLETVLLPDGGISVHGRAAQEGAEAVLYAAGTVTPRGDSLSPPRPLDVQQLWAEMSAELGRDEFYAGLSEVGLEYGPAFRGVERVWCGDRTAVGEVSIGESQTDRYAVHPALLDASLHVILAAVLQTPGLRASAPGLYLPVEFGEVRWHARPRGRVLSVVRVTDINRVLLTADVTVCDGDGRPLVEVRRLVCQHFAAADRGTDGLLYECRWVPSPSPADAARVWDRLPPLPEVLAGVAADVDRVPDAERGGHHTFWADLDKLCGAFVRAAVAELGVDFRAGRRFTTDALAGQLGVAEPHRRLLERLLGFLAEDGLLRRTAGGWETTGSVVDAEPAPLLCRMLVEYPSFLAELTLVARCGENLAALLKGDLDVLSLLFPDGNLTLAEHLYRDAPATRFGNGVGRAALERLLRHGDPGKTLRVLEVGAGTGGLTAYLLPVLPADRTEYVFSDVSPHFVVRAQERFVEFPFVRCQKLDLEADVEAQGFTPGSFDLVVSSHVLHATADLRQTLRNVRHLLAPGGLLLLLEAVNRARWMDMVFGLTEGWWRFADADLRPDHPLLSAEGWGRILAETGFTDTTDAATDTDVSELGTVVMLARNGAARIPHAAAGTKPAAASRWLLFADRGGVAEQLARVLGERGDSCSLIFAGVTEAAPGRFALEPGSTDDARHILRSLREENRLPAAGLGGLVYLWGLDAPGPDGLTTGELDSSVTGGCHGLVALLQAWQQEVNGDTRFVLVTRGAQAVEGRGTEQVSPAQAALPGLVRVAAREHFNLHCVTIDLGTTPEDGEAAALARELTDAEGDEEIALRGGARFVHRFRHAAERLAVAAAGDPPSYRLVPQQLGMIERVEYQACERPALGPGDVEIRVMAAGLNFQDVFKVLGLLPPELPLGPVSLGVECAGVVSAVGSGVKSVKPGDEVIAVAPSSLGSFTATREELVVPKPPSISFEEAATLPIAFLTADYALTHLGRLAEGESVLVHAATGGVGLAALQLVRRAGARVLATAGSPAKRDFLRRIGVPDAMNSRNLDFADEVMARTGGRGVDVVLNSLAGDAIGRGLDCLAQFGRFLEVGKRDILTNSRVGLRPFIRNLSYFAIALENVVRERPALIGRMLRDLVRDVAEGRLRPLPHRDFPVDRVAEAFQYMAHARHIGKVVVSFRTHPQAVLPPADPVRMCPGAAYLVTGGLGGFGLVTARWLADRGAEHLVLVGRRGVASEEAAREVEGLRGRGVGVTVAAADVSRPEDVRRVVADVAASGRPLRGVIHAALALEDCLLSRLDRDLLQRVLRPRVAGAWNLHRETLGQPLDFFVCFGSISGLFGSPGQASYAASNTFLDALAHHRRSLGLPALTVDWAYLGEVGYLARQKHLSERFEAQGLGSFSAAEAMTLLEQLLRRDATQAAVMRMDWGQAKRLASDGGIPPRFRELAQAAAAARAEGGGTVPSSVTLAALRDAAPAVRQRLMLALFREQLSQVLAVPAAELDMDVSLHSLGLDSLMAIQLNNRVWPALGTSIPVTVFLEGLTTSQIVERVLAQMERDGAFGAAAPAAKPVEVPPNAEQVDNLPEADLDALLGNLLAEQKGE